MRASVIAKGTQCLVGSLGPEVWYQHMDGGMVAWARWCSVSLAGEHVLGRSSRGQPEVTEVPMFSSVSSADIYLLPRTPWRLDQSRPTL